MVAQSFAVRPQAWEAGKTAEQSNILFSPSSSDTVSDEFTVYSNPVVIKGFGLAPDERVIFEMLETAPNGAQYAAPYRYQGCDLMVTAADPIAIIDIPGRYRAVLVGVPGASYVVCHEAEMVRQKLQIMLGGSARYGEPCNGGGGGGGN
jgi:hypothetical protein